MAEQVTFTGARGQRLTGVLDRPDGPVRAGALVVHCLPSGADDVAAAWTSRALAEHGYVVLRIDLSGAGRDAGGPIGVDVADLVAAADHLRSRGAVPAVLVGHSIGGSAVVALTERVPEARAVAIIGTPADPVGFLDGLAAAGERTSDGRVHGTIDGHAVIVDPSLAGDLAARPQGTRLAELGRALLVLHAPQDAVVGIDDARKVFDAARHPKSFVSVDGADHHLSRPEDARFVANVLAAWAERYLDAAPAAASAPPGALAAGVVHVRESGVGKYQQDVRVGAHTWTADEPARVGGDDAGPSPYDMLLAGLGTCTSMTLRMYVERKGWDVGPIDVVVRHDRVPEEGLRGVAGQVDRMRLVITVDGDLDETQRESILRIAGKCPVHRTLTHDVLIESALGT
jgi:uncharacterized OsmC-like protein/pimeloyl-ACP methyl ester carboxylesterase